MRYQRLLLILILLMPVLARPGETPKNLEPLPDAPPPPAMTDSDPAEEPEIKIIKKGEDTVEEYRIHGELYMQKITPSHGVPYYLMKQDQEGGWSRIESQTQPLIIPKWVILRF